ncbi:DUF2971 domain-containing protein [Flavobacterium sp. SUN046]|uniref:DUF2971 domain-containing protein n=1 Tax=Flavobacterium sp. SUN046 TaxID=3002440 RepID=UPI002DBD7F35|nr:DUF2971 domain-containing protein [Flavobacterium sp. SUN046]MEC4049117.1 DUF2971 domain-containing protein [Flavobacterium sp. SUN046]
MNLERNIRINKVLRELNISLQTGIDILNSGGIRIEPSHNSKINEFEFEYLKYRLKIPKIIEIPSITNQIILSKLRDKLGVSYTVFKYFGDKLYNLESFKEGYLYFSNYKSFNDPFDCNINLINFDKINKRKRIKDREEILKNNLTKLGICCFSRKVDSILMWSHYASNHSGFCIEFHSNQDLEGINPIDVNYVNNYLQAEYYKNQKDAIFHVIFTKAKQWQYEQELRSIRNKLIDDISRKIPFRKKDVKALYLGVNCKESTKKELLKIVNEVYQNKIEVFEGNLSNSNFEIVWNKLL